MKNILVYSDNKKFELVLSNLLKKLLLEVNVVVHDTSNIFDYYDYIIIDKDISFDCNIINCGYFFINMDLFKNKKIDINGNVISYGLGNKNTVTISSIEDENKGFVYCIQRYLDVEDNKSIIQPQEIPLDINYENDKELYVCMVAITIALIEKISIKNIKNRLNK
ncbi:hypothetical protein [Clostridium oceanicum]|uniref:Uncharacterized protein n=1 Tax=Clostridium oceanicum TaxID=1543 RepID=A0ABP3V798_9CLOT